MVTSRRRIHGLGSKIISSGEVGTTLLAVAVDWSQTEKSPPPIVICGPAGSRFWLGSRWDLRAATAAMRGFTVGLPRIIFL
jgi:hypothetical protein